MDAPWITVLSRSKKAAAVASSRMTGSGGLGSASASSGPGAVRGSDGSIRIAEASLSANGSAWSACPEMGSCGAAAVPFDPVTRPTLGRVRNPVALVPDFGG